MALAIHIASYISGGYVNPVIWRLYETGSGALIDEHQEMGPHGQVYNFSFVNNIRDIVYTVKLFDQPGGTGTGALIKSHDMTVTTSTVVFDADIETIVDGGEPEDPVSGTSTSPVIASLVGKSFYVVQRSIGQRRMERIPEINDNGDGSYTLLDDTFNPEDTWIIKIRPTFVVNPLGSQAGPNYKDVVLITADYALTNLDFGKLLIVDGALPVVTLQFPNLVDIGEKVTLSVQSVGTTHKNVVLKAATGETITATGETSNTMILGRATKAELIKLGSTLYGTTDDHDIRRRGQLEWGYSVGVNRLWADGSELLVADYPGLKKAMDSMLTGTVVTYAQKTSPDYRGFFALSDSGLNLKLPDLRNIFIRALDGMGMDADRVTQGAGGLQEAGMLDHNHNVGSEPSGIPEFNRGVTHTLKRAAGVGAGNIEVTALGSTGRVIPVSQDATYGVDTGEERPENIGLIPLIII